MSEATDNFGDEDGAVSANHNGQGCSVEGMNTTVVLLLSTSTLCQRTLRRRASATHAIPFAAKARPRRRRVVLLLLLLFTRTVLARTLDGRPPHRRTRRARR